MKIRPIVSTSMGTLSLLFRNPVRLERSTPQRTQKKKSPGIPVFVSFIRFAPIIDDATTTAPAEKSHIPRMRLPTTAIERIAGTIDCWNVMSSILAVSVLPFDAMPKISMIRTGRSAVISMFLSTLFFFKISLA
jgi:hypothetical protein